MGAPALLPIAIGAGVGALGSSLTGRNPLQGALLGGALGGVGGELIPAMQGAGQAAATSAGIPKEALVGAFGPEALPASQLTTNTMAGIAPNGAGVNLFGGMAPSGAGGAIPMEAFQQAATGTGTNIVNPTPSFFDGMSDYFTPQNVLGAANMMDQQSAAPQISSVGGGGGVRGGNTDMGETIQQFLQRLGARAQSPNRRQGLFY
jgi:hypothetical protein